MVYCHSGIVHRRAKRKDCRAPDQANCCSVACSTSPTYKCAQLSLPMPPSLPLPMSRVESHRRGSSPSNGKNRGKPRLSACFQLGGPGGGRALRARAALPSGAPGSPPGGAPGRCCADGGRPPRSVTEPVAEHAAVCESQSESGFLGWRAGETWAALPCAEQRHGLQPEGCRGDKHSSWLQLPRASGRLRPATYRL